ncbi:HXXXD-type acyl-transferase family protein [Medicago truncatula]|uniref:HXXXD-type acyl-transferase family protein n=1 Tax=Medicago truncatula TaxID=3880 RepID=A0A072U9N8_MEDTR|nr:HXXXD-type acyl-transferase family protein [Medicago truncatula]
MPTLERWFPNSVQLPIQFPFTMDKNLNDDEKEKLNPPERLFHFTKQKILQLKSKANTEAGTNNISSLQALFTHLWRSVVRSNQFDPQEEVHYMVVTGVRSRFVSPLPEDYFGNAVIICGVSMKAG